MTFIRAAVLAVIGLAIFSGCGINNSWSKDQFDLNEGEAQMFVYDAAARGQLVVFDTVWVNVKTGEEKENPPLVDVTANMVDGEAHKNVTVSDFAVMTDGKPIYLKQRRLRTFSESAPDVAKEQSLQLAFAAALSATIGAVPFEGSMNGSLAFAEKVITLAARTERVEVLRDGLMRISEANFNRSITGAQLVQAYERTLTTIVQLAATEAIAELAGLRKQLSAASARVAELAERLTELRKQLDRTTVAISSNSAVSEALRAQLLATIALLTADVDRAVKDRTRLEALIEENNVLKAQMMKVLQVGDAGLRELWDKLREVQRNERLIADAQVKFERWTGMAEGTERTALQASIVSLASSVGISLPADFKSAGPALLKERERLNIKAETYNEMIEARIGD